MKNDGSRAIAGIAAVALGLLVAGCSCWSYDPPLRGNPLVEGHNLAAVQAAVAPNPAGFSEALVADYASFATSLDQNDRDWADADYFARKGLAAARGVAVPPENNANWLIPLEVPYGFRTMLADGRARLVAALDGGGRDRLPTIAARAQVSYDCWVERMEDDWREAAQGPCHAQFLAALAQLEGGPVAVALSGREFRVYFEFDRAVLLPEAQEILRQVADRTKQDPKLTVTLVGKADRAGSDRYNIELSHRRADAVRAELLSDGVAAGAINETWVGERAPPVPTPDGVREPRNRVVEIMLQ